MSPGVPWFLRQHMPGQFPDNFYQLWTDGTERAAVELK